MQNLLFLIQSFSFMISQKQIAKKLGISRSAVAAALNPKSKSRTSHQTLKMIRETAKKMGYRPNRFAQILVTGKSRLIGVISQIDALQIGIQRHRYSIQRIQQKGYQPMIGEVLEGNIELVCQGMLDAKVEGILLANVSLGENPTKIFLKSKIPVISLADRIYRNVPHVRANFYQGMRDLTAHLLEVGHRRFTLVVPEYIPGGSIEGRVRGFSDVLKEAKIPSSHFSVWKEQSPNSPSYLKPHYLGWKAATEILKTKNRPDVILFSNDDWALGGLRAIFEAGLRVPQDIAVTGFDNAPLSEYLVSPLTTVAQPVQEMAESAVNLLFQQMEGGKGLMTKKSLIEIPTKLIVRESCGASLPRKP
ncbi:MAG: LacI family DNA-binding transcriptional regulator [Verrucomicrobiota bacterium]